MYKVDMYAKVRRACLVEGESQRSVARRYGINRRSVSKMLRHSQPPGYQQGSSRPKLKLDAYEEFINDILVGDKEVHPKQRHTAKRIYDRLSEDKGYTGVIRLSVVMSKPTVNSTERFSAPYLTLLVMPKLTLEKLEPK